MEFPSSWRRFFAELKRRSVYRVAVAYLAVAFVGFQAAKLLIPSTVLPPWTDEFFLFLLIIGFPVALVIAWAFELTPEGIRRTPLVKGEAEGATSTPPEERRAQSRLAMQALVALGLVAAAVAGGWYLMGGGGETEPRVGDRSIAVLPFENMGGEESEQFTQGVHDGLLTRLSNVSGLKVISRTSVMQFEETELPLPTIADSLGVKWVMESGVQKMGDQLQVNAQLIDPRTDTHAWADSYRRDLTATDLFAIQTDITKRIARSLEARLSPEEEKRVERSPTGDLEAFRLYVQGRDLLAQRTEQSIREATGYFERALRRDSSYALAWAGLADAQVLTAIYDLELSEDRRKALTDVARVSARRARKLDPDLAEAWTALGAIHVYEQRRGWTEGSGPVALQQLRRAVELKPSYAHAQQWLAELYLYMGRPEKALEHASLAVELDPEHAAARQNLIWALIANDRGAEGWSHFQQYPRPIPWLRALALYHSSRWDQLERFSREQLQKEEGGPWRIYLARIAALRGDTAGARQQLAWFREQDDRLGKGGVHAVLGEYDGTLEEWRAFGGWTEAGGLTLLLRYCFPTSWTPFAAIRGSTSSSAGSTVTGA